MESGKIMYKNVWECKRVEASETLKHSKQSPVSSILQCPTQERLQRMCTETSWRWAVEDPKCATLLLRHTALQGRSTWTCRDNLQDTCRMTSGCMKFLPSKALKAFHGDFHFHNPNHWISKRDPESSAIPKTHLTSPIRSWPIWDKIKPQHEIAEILQILHILFQHVSTGFQLG